MKKLFYVLVLAVSAFSISSCETQDVDKSELNQKEKFDRLSKLIINPLQPNSQDVNARLLNDPDKLSEEEIKILAEESAAIYLEIKDEYLHYGGNVNEFDQYFADELEEELIEETRVMIGGGGPMSVSCWSDYGTSLGICSLSYAHSLSQCTVGPFVNPVCAWTAYTSFAACTWASFNSFNNCLKEQQL